MFDSYIEFYLGAQQEQLVVPAIPQSEVLAKCLQEIGENCSDILANCFTDFRPSISRENGRRKNIPKNKKILDIFHSAPNKVLHCCNSGGWGAQLSVCVCVCVCFLFSLCPLAFSSEVSMFQIPQEVLQAFCACKTSLSSWCAKLVRMGMGIIRLQESLALRGGVFCRST